MGFFKKINDALTHLADIALDPMELEIGVGAHDFESGSSDDPFAVVHDDFLLDDPTGMGGMDHMLHHEGFDSFL